VIPALLVAAGVALAWVPRPSIPHPRTGLPQADDERDWVQRGRGFWAALAMIGGVAFGPGPLSFPIGMLAAAAVWTVVGRAEPASARRRAAAVARDLPTLVELVAAALEAGLAVPSALELASSALPGAGADVLRPVVSRLRLEVRADEVWESAGDGGALAPLSRALARAQSSGASVATGTRQLADDLADLARQDIEGKARAVGVRAALPLGLCLLPAFVVLGVVPMVAGAVGSLGW